MKLVPFTSRVCTCEPAAICVGLSDVMTGTGLLFPPPPPPPPPLPPPQLSKTASSIDPSKTLASRRREKGIPIRHPPSKTSGPEVCQGRAEVAFAFSAALRDWPIAVVVTVSEVVTLPLLGRVT